MDFVAGYFGHGIILSLDRINAMQHIAIGVRDETSREAIKKLM